MNMKPMILMLALAASSSAFAAESGFYLGGGFGQSKYSGGLVGQIEEAYAASNTYTLTSAELVDDSDDAWKLMAGYRFGNGFGLEASWADLGQVASLYHTLRASPLYPLPDYLMDGRYEAQAYGISAFYEWEFSPKVSAMLRAGAFNASLDYSEESLSTYSYEFANDSDGTVPGFGLGLNWRITQALDLRLDYDRYQGVGKRFGLQADTNGRFDIGMYSLNLAFRFGK